MAELSEKQKKILNYIEQYHDEKGYPPTLREICQKFQISSTNGARYHLHRLKELGYLEIEPHKSRGVKSVSPSQNSTPGIVYRMPILGDIPAGPFNLAEADIDEEGVTIDPEFFGSRGKDIKLFGLRVKGDSMTGSGIYDGDIVIVKPQQEARDGDIVVARMEEEATVKSFRRGKNKIILEPSNPAYPPIEIDNLGGLEFGQNFDLLGVVIGLIRTMRFLHPRIQER